MAEPRKDEERSRRAEDQVFLPNFCAVRNVFVLVLLTELLVVLLVLAGVPGRESLLTRLSLTSLLAQWIALICAAVLCALRGPLNRLGNPVVAGAAFLVVLLVTAGVSEVAYQLMRIELGIFAGADGPAHGLFLARNLAIAAVVVALSLRYLYVQHQWRLNLRNEAEARIQALQARIQPHFLFNSMNTIASLIRARPETAEEAVEDLSDLIRASLSDARTRIPLSEELELCRHYERIERLRLGERLEVTWDLAALPDDAVVPRLCLQPLLENAIYHGIEGRPEGGTVEVRGQADEGMLELSVRNPLPPRDSRHRRRGSGYRLALANIGQRLRLVYGDRAALEQTQDNEHYRVTMRFPLFRRESAEAPAAGARQAL